MREKLQALQPHPACSGDPREYRRACPSAFVGHGDKSATRCGCPADVVNDNVNSSKAIQDFVDHLGCAFGGRDICLNKMIVRLFRRGGARGYDYGCSSSLEAVGNRLACALRAAGYQNSLAGKFV